MSAADDGREDAGDRRIAAGQRDAQAQRQRDQEDEEARQRIGFPRTSQAFQIAARSFACIRCHDHTSLVLGLHPAGNGSGGGQGTQPHQGCHKSSARRALNQRVAGCTGAGGALEGRGGPDVLVRGALRVGRVSAGAAGRPLLNVPPPRRIGRPGRARSARRGQNGGGPASLRVGPDSRPRPRRPPASAHRDRIRRRRVRRRTGAGIGSAAADTRTPAPASWRGHGGSKPGATRECLRNTPDASRSNSARHGAAAGRCAP